MNDEVRVVCPKCKGELAEIDSTAGHCLGCGLRYSILFAIPDLRYPVGDRENDPELIIAERLIAAFPASSFSELVDIYFSSIDTSTVPDHLISHYRLQRTNQLSRGQQFAQMFSARLKEYFDLPDSASALELGSGTGASLVTLSRDYANVVGIDPSLPSLILARKFCEDNQIRNVRLIQAYGQHLPFPENSFTYVTAQNVLEHVFDIEDVMLEVHRVLKHRGGFAADSRNRFDAFFPEPHVQLRGVGFLPRGWANSYVRWRIGMSYDAVHTRLLSYFDLQKALRKPFGNHHRVVTPRVSAYNMSEKWDRLFTRLERFKWLQQLLVIIFPSHVALAQKQSPDQ